MTLHTSNSVVSIASNISAIPEVIDYNISQITPYVYVTAENTARQFQQVFSNGIGCVINVANELPQIVFPSQSGIESLKYPIEDNPTFPVSKYFDTVADRIAANVTSNRRTLVYCHHGRSRSVTFILAYLIKHHQLPLPIAYALVKQQRQLAMPNVGFWSQLLSYDLHQQQKNTSTVIKYFNNSLSFGQKLAHSVSDGFQQVFTRNPIVDAFTNTVHLITQKSHVHPYYHTIRRKPQVYQNSYQGRLPPGLYRRRYF